MHILCAGGEVICSMRRRVSVRSREIERDTTGDIIAYYL